MILIRAVIYFFLSVIFDQQLKITFRKYSAPPLLLILPLKIRKSPPFAKFKNFSASPLQRGQGGHCVSKSLINITGSQFICLNSAIPTWAHTASQYDTQCFK